MALGSGLTLGAGLGAAMGAAILLTPEGLSISIDSPRKIGVLLTSRSMAAAEIVKPRNRISDSPATPIQYHWVEKLVLQSFRPCSTAGIEMPMVISKMRCRR